MLDSDITSDTATTSAPAADAVPDQASAPPAKARKRPAKKAAPAAAPDATEPAPTQAAPAKAAKKVAKKAAKKVAGAAPANKAAKQPAKKAARAAKGASKGADADSGAQHAAPALAAPAVLFQAPDETQPPVPARKPRAGKADLAVAEAAEDQTAEPEDVREAAVEEATGARRRRRRGRRGRGGGGQRPPLGESGDETDEVDGDDRAESAGDDATVGATGAAGDAGDAADLAEAGDGADGVEGGETAATRRRRRRRRAGAGGEGGADGAGGADVVGGVDVDPPNTVVHVREARPKSEDDGVKGVKGSTRLEAKRQRRRDGRDTGRRRPPILSESEFLARREAVDRVMAVRQSGDRTQIAVLEDGVLVEHYVTRASASSYVGNVYLGRVQNVLPSMEAAFVDIGKGRNGVLYAGEVNWDAAGLEGKSRNIESALKSGDAVLVQVTKDPIGHKGARLTSQVSLPGRFLVYVPGGGMTGISRKLPDTERHRLKTILKKIVPEDAGVIIRTAAEGATEEELTHDVERLKAQWEKIDKKSQNTKAAPALVHGEPDLAIRVVRDVFNEDFKQLVVQGEGAWQTVSEYVEDVAPSLGERVSRHTGGSDIFADLRVDEQLMKALDRKVWLPSGGSLVIDRTEAMTVIDVNTGKFVGTGGNLEQTVTRNNLEAAEEIVRQLRLRDVGGIVVIDFIDMVLESNRELVLRRLTECLGRDRTKHQVAEVTSLGLVQMTRKRVGEGLLEAFSEPCEVCKGRGVIIHTQPVDRTNAAPADADDDRPRAKRRRAASAPSKDDAAEAIEDPVVRERRLAAMAAVHRAAHHDEEFTGADFAGDAAELEMEAVAAVISGETIDAEPIEAEPIDAEPIEAEPIEAEPIEAEAIQAELPTAEPAVPVAAAPRRRRAASRPAGPPVAAAVE